MTNLTNLVQFAQQLSRSAGTQLVQAYQQQSSSNINRRESPKAMKLLEDSTIDQWLVQHIHATYPDHSILTEESGLLYNTDQSSYRWIIDPIDGSVNFSNHNPFFAISMAVQINGVLEIGIIEAPLLGEQFVAVRGHGATVNGQPIRVSTTAKLQQAYVLSCDGGMTDRTQVFSTLIRNYYDQVIDFRKLGSAALECAWVASGRADGYITMAIDPWDIAAGVVLIEEAGGQVTTFHGEPWQAQQLDVIASNGLLHQAFMDRIWD
ncbi:MAG: inositol monophosphatase [Candidatus Kerfeldbacteria bacterium]|nr:inositol monophosphatase [Candidatus Kerfeldbacteria bacterium]